MSATQRFSPMMKKVLKAIWSWFLKSFSWSVIKIIGGSYLSGIVIAVPIFGYLIFYGSTSDGVYTFNFQEWSASVIVADEEFSFIRLKFTYVGLFIIGLSTMIFRVLCPREVANYKNERHYVQDAIDTTYSDAAIRLLEDLKNSRWYDAAIPSRAALRNEKIISDRQQRAPANSGSHRLLRGDWLEKNNDLLNAIYSTQYQTVDYSRIFLRAMILCSYSLGIALTLIPSWQIFYPVFVQLISYLQS